MQLVIDDKDFRRLKPEIQTELLEVLGGYRIVPQGSPSQAETPGLRWRQPVDLTRDHALRIVHGLSEDHRRRLKLFARKNGRVRMTEILALTGETDLRATAQFQQAVTRRLRRIVQDPEKKAQLIAWDFDSTKWDEKGTTILDGVYFVSPATARALRDYFSDEDVEHRATG